MLFVKAREPSGPVPELEMRHTDPKRIDAASLREDKNEA